MTIKQTMLTVQEVADLKNVEARTVRGWIERGLLEAEQITPRLYLIPARKAQDFQPPVAGRPSKNGNHAKKN